MTSAPGRLRPAAAVVVATAMVLTLATLVAPAAADTAGVAAGPASITVSQTTGLDPEGQTVTVTGSGFDPGAHVGTRPPLMGQPSGVYVIFGRFGDPWAPSEGAPSSNRQVVSQLWALGADSRAVLDPSGTSDSFITIAPDGSFTATLDVAPADGTGEYAIATYAGSGAVNADQEAYVPLSFGTDTEPEPEPEPELEPEPEAGTATGPTGQQLTVTPSRDLDPDGATVRVTGTGYDESVGVYVALCVDQGAGVAPSPCLGGAAMEGSDSSAWISSDPPDYATHLTTPFGPGGTFDVELTLVARDDTVDCDEPGTRCVVATRADHTASSDRSADVKVAVLFEGQEVEEPAPTTPTPTKAQLDATTVRAGEALTVRGGGFLAGEQVQVWLHSEPRLIDVVTTDPDGSAVHRFTVPADTPAGEHHVELRGITSGLVLTSDPFTVLAAEAAPPPAPPTPGAPPAAGPATLPATGRDGSLALAVTGAVLLAAGAALATFSRRRLVAGDPLEAQEAP